MSPDDNELIRQAQRGDDSAFEKLIEKYDRHVLSLAFSYTRNSDDTKDIYQETFIRAYNAINRFQFRSEFSTWLYRIVINVCLSFNKRRKREARMTTSIQRSQVNPENCGDIIDPSLETSAEANYLRSELAANIEGALGGLSPMQRMVFTMKHYEGYKLKEIAQITNCAEGTVKKHLFNAVRRLQIELKELLE